MVQSLKCRLETSRIAYRTGWSVRFTQQALMNKSDFTPDEHLAFRHRVTPLEKMIRHGVYVIPTPDDQQPLAPIPKTRT